MVVDKRGSSEEVNRLTWLVGLHAGVAVTFRVIRCDPHLQLRQLGRVAPPAFGRALLFRQAKRVLVTPKTRTNGPWTQHGGEKRHEQEKQPRARIVSCALPSVRVLQQDAARSGRGAAAVHYHEAGGAQLEWSLADLDLLRQRPQGAELWRLDFQLGLVVDVAGLQRPAKAQKQQQQSSGHFDSRLFKSQDPLLAARSGAAEAGRVRFKGDGSSREMLPLDFMVTWS